MIWFLTYLLMTYVIVGFIFFGISYALSRAFGNNVWDWGTLWFGALWPIHIGRFIVSMIRRAT